jgi:hypothetical protein
LITIFGIVGLYLYFYLILTVAQYIPTILFIVASVGGGAYMILLAGIGLYRLLIDYKFLRALDIPDRVNRKWVYHTCQQFHFAWGRLRFLQALHARGIEVDQDERPVPLPQDKWVDGRVRTELSRLESMWNGLDE